LVVLRSVHVLLPKPQNPLKRIIIVEIVKEEIIKYK